MARELSALCMNRQAHTHPRALWRGFDRYSSAVQIYEAFDDAQAESETARVVAILSACVPHNVVARLRAEGFENLREVFLANSFALVGHIKLDKLAIAPPGDLYGRSIRRKSDGVAQQIQNYIFQLLGVALNGGKIGGDGNNALLRAFFQEWGDFLMYGFDDRAEIDHPQVKRRIK